MMTNVLGCNDQSPVRLALMGDGIDDMFAFCSMDLNDLDDMTYQQEGDAAEHSLRRSDKALIRILFDYILHRNSGPDPIDDNWTAVTQEQFDEYRVSPVSMS